MPTVRALRLPLLAFGGLCALSIGAPAQTTTQVVPIGAQAEGIGRSAGAALWRVTQFDDSLGTRPSSTIADVALGFDGGWRTSVTFDHWKPGNRRRLLASAYISHMPLYVYGAGSSFRPKRDGWDVRQHWRRGEASWLYLGIGSRRSDGGSRSGVICDPWGNCPASLREQPQDALSFAPTPYWWVEHRKFTILTARGGLLRDTRDNVFAPDFGRYLDLSVLVHRYGEDGYATMSRSVRLDTRAYRRDASGSVWAVQGLVFYDANGGVPLVSDEAAELPVGRDYTAGRGMYTRSTLFGQVEWRSPTRWANNRLGMAFFGSASASGWERSGSGSTVLGVGGGLRYRLNPSARSTVRLDFTSDVRTRNGRALYLALQEAF